MYEKTIILIRDKADGERFRSLLAKSDALFANVPICTKEELLIRPSLASNAETVFSTWYMPVFSYEEVVRLFPSLKYVFYSAGTVKYFAEPFMKKEVRVFSAAAACITAAL